MGCSEPEILSSEDIKQIQNYYGWLARRNDENIDLMRAFEAAAKPVVENIREKASETGAKFKVSADLWKSSPDYKEICEYRYTVQAYAVTAGEGASASYGVKFEVFQNGAVVIQKFTRENPRKGVTLYKTNLRRFDCGWFGLGKAMPEKMNTEEISSAMRKGLIETNLLAAIPG